MKIVLFPLLALFLAIASNSASAQAGSIWTCATAQYPQAFVVSLNPVPGEFDLAATINDPQICATLKKPCPFRTLAKSGNNGEVVGLANEYQSGVMLFHDGAGMKLYSAHLDHEKGRIALDERNWYFNYGECR